MIQQMASRENDLNKTILYGTKKIEKIRSSSNTLFLAENDF